MSSRIAASILILLGVVCGRVGAAEAMPPHESLLLSSAVMGETRRINVYLPPTYDLDKIARFPVLYMLDGGTAEDFSHVTSTADQLIRTGAVKPFVIVGVENTIRRRDMTGPTQAPDDLKVTSDPGGAPAFRRFFNRELMPVVSSRYRVTDETAVIGESLAGLFVVDTLLAQPDLFSIYIAVDPSLWWNLRGAIREAPDRLAHLGTRSIRLLLTAGGEQSNVAEVESFADVLQKVAPAGLCWDYIPRPDLRHDDIYRISAKHLLREAFRRVERSPEF